MSLFLLSFLAAFLFIFLKAFQQLNVVHYKYLLVIPTSFLMAICEVYVIANVAKQGYQWPLIVAVGLGGGMGCVCSMWVHRNMEKWWDLVNKAFDMRPMY